MPTFSLVYPPAHNDTYVKATSKASTSYWPYYATDPAKSLTGSFTSNSWDAAAATNQRFHIDLGSAKIVTKVYYENGHSSGGYTNIGAKVFTMWGSNTDSAFAELTYGTDTNWTQLTTEVSQFDQHAAADSADPKYFLVTNTTAYRYYAFKISTNWGGAGEMNLRRIVLMTTDVITLTVADMTLAQVLDSIVLTQHNALAVQDMTLAQVLDNLTLGPHSPITLLVQNIVLGMYLDNVPNLSLAKLKTLGIKEYNFPTIEKGDSYEWETNLTDDMGNILLGLTAATISCIVKSQYDHSILADFSSKFTLTSGTGKLSFNLTPADTSAITWAKGIYWLKINYASGVTRTIQYGEMPVDLG